MAASIEVQIINKILNEKSLDILIDYGVDSSYFSEFKAVIDFIINHHETYQVIPDSFTLCSKFNQFELIEVNEPNEFLMAQLFEQKLWYINIRPNEYKVIMYEKKHFHYSFGMAKAQGANP